MKQNTLIIILVLVAAGIGVYIWQQRMRMAAERGGTSVSLNIVTERGGVSNKAAGQVEVPQATTLQYF